MKKSKLQLEKFRVSKINNLRKIFGGNETDNDGTRDTLVKVPKCRKGSKEYVYENN